MVFLVGCKDDCAQYEMIPFWYYNSSLKIMIYQPIMTCVKYKDKKRK